MNDSHALATHAQSFLTALGAGPITSLDSTTWGFPWLDTYGVAASDGRETEFELVLVEDAAPDELRRWLADQPAAVRDWFDVCDSDGVSELTYTGFVDPDLDLARVRRMGEVLREIAEAWGQRSTLLEGRRTELPYRPATDPMDLPVINAWLVVGSEASMPTPQDLAQQQADAASGDYTWTWTVNKATRAGDLLLFYFTAPSKSLKYVARAASDAYFERASSADAQQGFSPSQWWAHITALTPIPDVAAAVVVDLLEQPVLRGASGKYCKPEGITRLQQWFQRRHPGIDVTAHLPCPTGNPDLPDPDTMSLPQWRLMADGALYPEKVVESHVVGPLVKFLVDDLGSGYELRGQYPLGRHKADYVLVRNDHPQLVIETKVAVRRSQEAPWSDSPDFRQVAGYAKQLGTRAALVDARAIYLLSLDLTDVDRIIERRHVDEAALAQLRDLVRG